MKIQIAGPGCPKVEETEKHVREACASAHLDAQIEVVHDPKEIARLHVVHTPGVVVDGRVIESGHVPSVDRIKEALTTLVQMQRAKEALRIRI